MAPVPGSIWWIWRSRYWPTHRLPSAQVRPESRPWPGAGIDATTVPLAGSTVTKLIGSMPYKVPPMKFRPITSGADMAPTGVTVTDPQSGDAVRS